MNPDDLVEDTLADTPPTGEFTMESSKTRGTLKDVNPTAVKVLEEALLKPKGFTWKKMLNNRGVDATLLRMQMESILTEKKDENFRPERVKPKSGTKKAKLVKALDRAGIKVGFFKDNRPGTTILGYSDKNGNVILLNDSLNDSDQLEKIAAHEITHQLQKTKLWDELVEWINENDQDELFAAGEEYFEQIGGNAQDELAFEKWFFTQNGVHEAVAQYVENRALDANLWALIARDNPGLIEKIRETIARLISTLRDANIPQQSIFRIQKAFDQALSGKIQELEPGTLSREEEEDGEEAARAHSQA
jgi:hypothetical protein